jgi:hypothetical protein
VEQSGNSRRLSDRLPDQNWQVAAVSGPDRPGAQGILLQHRGADVGAWLTNGGTFRFGALVMPPRGGDAGWRIVAPR